MTRILQVLTIVAILLVSNNASAIYHPSYGSIVAGVLYPYCTTDTSNNVCIKDYLNTGDYSNFEMLNKSTDHIYYIHGDGTHMSKSQFDTDMSNYMAPSAFADSIMPYVLIPFIVFLVVVIAL